MVLETPILGRMVLEEPFTHDGAEFWHADPVKVQQNNRRNKTLTSVRSGSVLIICINQNQNQEENTNIRLSYYRSGSQNFIFW